MKITFSLILLAGMASSASAQSTISASAKHAWSANTGWIDARPSASLGFRFGEFSCAGWLWSPNTGWIDCGDGSPANGINYDNSSNTDYGVNHYGTGDLYGLAWSPNTGWINFGWATLDPGNANRPRVDLFTGEFAGYAWSANCGWISLTGVKTGSMAIPDEDGDGISDAFEVVYNNGDLDVMDGTSDSDGDGHSDLAEYLALTNPLDAGSFMRVTRIAPVNPDGTATALTWTSSPARRYQVERSTDLGAADPWHLSTQDPHSFAADAGGETTRTTFDTASPSRFFRVKVLVPLQP